jgi:uncharacterized membrane protein YfcA
MTAAAIALFALLGAASLATSFISGILGMAGGMILMGVLIAVLPVTAAMTLHGITQFTSNAGRACMSWREIHWRIFAGYLGGGILAASFFALIHFRLGKAGALIAIGITPFIGLALPASWRLDVTRRGHAFACGLACVTMSLTAGIAGPILDIFFVRSPLGRRQVVATKALTQAFSHALKVAYFGVMLEGTGGLSVPTAAAMVLLAIAGTRLSKSVLERMTDASFRRWTRGTVMGIGMAYGVMGVAMLRG